MKRQPIKTPNEIYEEILTDNFNNISKTMSEIIQRQQLLFTMSSVAINSIHTLKRILEKNGIISSKEYDSIFEEIQKNSMEKLENLKNEDYLNSIDISKMTIS